MRLLLRRLLPYLPLAALALLIIWPSIRYGPTYQTDGPNHFYRFVELDWHFRHGDFYPRWFSDLHYGYGAPVLNFYAPLSYYIWLIIHFFGFSFPLTFQLGFWLAIAVAIVGMYYWARDQFGSSLAGLTAALAYTMSPYLYLNLLGRAGHPEAWALAMAPWLFWVALRWMRQPFRGARVMFTLLLAALFLTHNISALMLTPLFGLYCLSLSLDQSGQPPARPPLRTALWLGVSLLQALGLAAFFLVPFLLEAQDIQLYRASLPKIFQYQNNFLEWHTIFSLPAPFDPYHVIHSDPISLAWPTLALAVAAAISALVVWRRKGSPFPLVIVVLTVASASLIVLMNFVSLPLWQAVPLATLIQFPSRLMAPATLLLSWLAAAALPGGRWRWPTALAFALATFFYTLTWTYHEPFKQFPQHISGPADVIRYEIAEAPFAAGTTFSQEFLPRWVQEIPPPDSMLPRYADSDLPSRLAEVPPGVALLEQHNGVKTTDFTYEATATSTATFNQFYFPGWTATVDGQMTPIRLSGPQGLMTVTLPAGRHNFRLTLTPTPAQVLGSLISLVALLAFLIPVASPVVLPRLTSHPAGLPAALTWLFVGLLVLRAGLLDRVETPFYHTEFDKIPNPLRVNFGDQLLLIGYKYPLGKTLISGETFDLRLYWQAAQSLTVNYQTTVQLVDGQGNRFGQSDNQHPAQMPTSNWKTDQYAIDDHALPSFTGAPPGEYHLRVGVYALTENGTAPLNVLIDGTLSGIEYDLGTVTVLRARPQPAGSLRLVESSLAAQTLGVGEGLPFTTVWASGPAPAPGLKAHLILSGADGQELFAADFPPAGPDYASDGWTPNEVIRYPHNIILPPDLPAGPATATISLLHADGTAAAGPFELGVITVTVPERSFAVPTMTRRVNYDFNGAIRLLGYDRTPDSITLYWQSLAPVSTRLTVFVHRFDEAGLFIGGSDSPPERPTTSWLPGEVLTDVRPVTVGDHFEIGLYDSLTGERFGSPFSNQP